MKVKLDQLHILYIELEKYLWMKYLKQNNPKQETETAVIYM